MGKSRLYYVKRLFYWEYNQDMNDEIHERNCTSLCCEIPS